MLTWKVLEDVLKLPIATKTSSDVNGLCCKKRLAQTKCF